MTREFQYSNQDFIKHLSRLKNGENGVMTARTPFDITLQNGWTDRMDRGLFRYQLGDLQTRILPGQHCFVAQLNVLRGTERRKPQEILSIQQRFNDKQFNFNKINPDEIIFEMKKIMDAERGLLHGNCRVFVVVNVSPLEFGHCLFVPEPSQCFPQILTPFAVQTGIESVLLSSDPGFRVGFNSLCAFASVNHLHLHGYYLNQELKIESAPLMPLFPEKGFYRVTDFPTGFLFYTEADELERVSCAVCQVTDFLVKSNKAHNLFFTRGSPPCSAQETKEACLSRRGVRVMIWPRMSCYGAKEESAFNVALCELAGHLPFKNKQDYENLTEKDVVDIIQGHLLPKEEFKHLEEELTALFQSSDQ